MVNFEEQELSLQAALHYRDDAKRGAASVLVTGRQQEPTGGKRSEAQIWRAAGGGPAAAALPFGPAGPPQRAPPHTHMPTMPSMGAKPKYNSRTIV
jgi:hypothetical protein